MKENKSESINNFLNVLTQSHHNANPFLCKFVKYNIL